MAHKTVRRYTGKCLSVGIARNSATDGQHVSVRGGGSTQTMIASGDIINGDLVEFVGPESAAISDAWEVRRGDSLWHEEMQERMSLGDPNLGSFIDSDPYAADLRRIIGERDVEIEELQQYFNSGEVFEDERCLLKDEQEAHQVTADTLTKCQEAAGMIASKNQKLERALATERAKVEAMRTRLEELIGHDAHR